MEERIRELELRFTEQQDLLQQLSDVVYAQQRAIDMLESELSRLKQKTAEPGVVDASEKERPPHY